MRILLFTDTLGDLNGVSRFIQDMGELAEEAGIELSIATSTSKPLPDKPYIHNLPYRFKWPMPFYQELDLVWPKSAAIQTLLKQINPDMVHISTPGPFGWIAKNIAQRLGYPLVGTYHTDFPAYLRDLTGSDWIKHRTDNIMAKFYRPFVHVFSRSEQYLEIMANDIAIDYDRASVIYPGTHLQKFNIGHLNRDVWHKFGLSGERMKVLYVGRINIEKNIPFLIEAWKQFKNQYPKLKADLVMIGEGRYRKWADKVRPHHAYFLGPVVGDKLSQLYASSDLFVFPSTTDTLGQVVMEAQASGLDCLVSDIGGPQTLVIDDSTGKILQADELNVWSEQIAESLKAVAARNEHYNSACVEHMQQYNIRASFEHFMQTHQRLFASIKQQQSDRES